MTESKFIATTTDLDEIMAPRGWFRSSGNKIFSAGLNCAGQLGINTVSDRSSHVQEVSASGSWKSISAAGSHILALKNNGTIWGWGENNFGQIGDNRTANRSSPVLETTSSTDWCYVSAGGSNSFAIKNDATLWGWGANLSGQLIDGFKINRSSPVQEYTSSSWSSVSSGHIRSFGAIKTDGTLWMWGINSCGMLGNGDTLDKSSPVKEASNSTNWCSLAISGSHSSAIKKDGTLWTWGSNNFAQLGSGNIIDTCSPIQEITNSSDWKITGAGAGFTQAIKKDNSLWTWGSTIIQGIGSVCSPVQETTSSYNWIKNNVGPVNSMAIKTDGTLWVWGVNTCGSLGLGTTTTNYIPTQVGIKTTWKDVSAGSDRNTHAIEMSDTLC